MTETAPKARRGKFRQAMAEFLREPHGTGSKFNIHMLRPTRLLHTVRTAVTEPRYFVSRLGVMVHQMRYPHAPWLTAKSIRFIEQFLTPEMKVFEWGSGRSTVWLAQRVGMLVSVEDDGAWYERVKRELANYDVDYRHATDESGAQGYAGQIAEFDDGTFDLVLVDGAHRAECLATARTKVRSGGVIVLDNADQDYDVSSLSDFECRPTSNGVWRTDLFIAR